MLFDIPFKSVTFCFIPLSRAENLAKTLVHSSISKRKRAKTRVLARCPHQNAIHSSVSQEKPAKTRVLAGLPFENHVKRVSRRILTRQNAGFGRVNAPERGFWLGLLRAGQY